MPRYEYKIVDTKASSWSPQSASAQEALLDVLNREGRGGWRLVPLHQPAVVPWRSVLLERELA